MNFKNLKNLLSLEDRINKADITDILVLFNEYSGQNIPIEIVNEFRLTGLSNIDFLTSDFLPSKGFKNYLQIDTKQIIGLTLFNINYSLPKDSLLSMKIYNETGQSENIINLKTLSDIDAYELNYNIIQAELSNDINNIIGFKGELFNTTLNLKIADVIVNNI